MYKSNQLFSINSSLITYIDYFKNNNTWLSKKRLKWKLFLSTNLEMHISKYITFMINIISYFIGIALKSYILIL